jgi:hypothetical protein
MKGRECLCVFESHQNIELNNYALIPVVTLYILKHKFRHAVLHHFTGKHKIKSHRRTNDQQHNSLQDILHNQQ